MKFLLFFTHFDIIKIERNKIIILLISVIKLFSQSCHNLFLTFFKSKFVQKMI